MYRITLRTPVILLSLCVGGLFFSCSTTKKTINQTIQAPYQVYSVQKYVNTVEADPTIQLIDVRTPGEFEDGHIPGAVNVNFGNENFSTMIEKLDNSVPVYIYCRSGNRSRKSSKYFMEKGFKSIIDLNGGYKAYKKFKEIN